MVLCVGLCSTVRWTNGIGELICRNRIEALSTTTAPRPARGRRELMTDRDVATVRVPHRQSAPHDRYSTPLEKGTRPHQLYRGKPSSSPGVRNGLILLIAFLFVFGEGLPS